MNLAEAYAELQIKTDMIPSGASNRPGTTIRPQFVCIHETDNPSPGADALAHARYLKGDDARRRKVSWHYTVDTERVVKHLPLSEKGFHAGTSEGNRKSVGIEICVHQGIDQPKANRRAALLAAVLCQAFDLSVEAVVPHRHWSGKACPAKILAGAGGFADFRSKVADYLRNLD